MRKILVVALLLSLASAIVPLDAAAEPFPVGQHAIDKREAACIEADTLGSDVVMMECTDRAYEEWDAELNKLYRELLGLLPAADADALRRAQRHWVEFRDAEFEVLGATYREQGTMERLMNANARTNLVRDRALQLESHRDRMTGCAYDNTLCGEGRAPASE